jgi:16S rRNA (adenine1518-N6/adenine1519-N6)-dimethyltransferase
MSNPYLARGAVRAALRSLDMRPTRGMGQNFLVDAHALHQIVGAAEIGPDDLVVEVGPGLGVLTWELLQQAGQVVAVELDKRLAARLTSEFAAALEPQQAARLHVAQGDILRLPPPDLLHQAGLLATPDAEDVPPYSVVANLPYAITSPVLRHFLEATLPPRLLVVLVQWEVAQRIIAEPGRLSILAHAVQVYAEPEIVARVAAGSFEPPPAVDSAVLRLHVRPTPAVDVANMDDFFRVLKAGFSQPRKKLANALPGGLRAQGEAGQREQAIAALEAAGVAPERRAETVTLAEWAAIYRALRQPG